MNTDCPRCQCGCGRPARIATRNRPERGQIKGQPVPYLSGHHFRKPVRYLVEDRGYSTPCWVWQLHVDVYGYGRVRVGALSNVSAHRHYYEEANGSIPEGLQLDHLCRVRRCVNPEHLEAVTDRENSRRGLNTRLTEAQVREIHNSDLKGVELARLYGVSGQTISKIRHGRGSYTWVA